ncbi:MAG: ARMT1-like domain-containing protein [Candidatus Auribacterota bacterium]
MKFPFKIFLSVALLAVLISVFSVRETRSSSLPISDSIGYVKDSYKSKKEADSQVIYYIQDAHCNAEAQMNIYKIIKFLVQEEEVGLIAMEGAAGEINPVDLSSFPYEEAKQIVSYYFVNRGRINGAEYYVINEPDHVGVQGVENRDLYQRNFECLLKAYNHDDVLRYVERVEVLLEDIKPLIFSDDMQVLDLLEKNFDGQSISLMAFLEQIRELALKYNCGLDEYKNLGLCWQLIGLEKSLDLNEIEKQRAKLIRHITESMNRDEVAAFLQENLKFRLNKVSYSDHLTYLLRQAESHGVDVGPFPQLSQYSRYLTVNESINHHAVFAEIDSLREVIFEALASSEEERALRMISDQVVLLKKASVLRSSSREWRKLTDAPLFFENDESIGFLSSHLDADSDIKGLCSSLKDSFSVIRSFYNLAEQRDSVMVDNTLNFMKERGVARAVIVAGGYHTSGIAEKLQQKDISHHILGVRINNDDTDNPYAQLVKGSDSRLERYLAGELDTLALASWLEEHPLVNANNRLVFGNMFKSMLISTLAWQMTGYDLPSVQEISLPMLRGIKAQLANVADQVGYDIDIIELSRVDNQIYIRMSVAGQELVYGLFAEQPHVDLAEVDSEKLQTADLLSSFQLLGGSVVVLTPEQYDAILTAAARKESTREAGPVSMVRSLLTHARSEHVIKAILFSSLNEKNINELSARAQEIATQLASMNFSEDPVSVENYIRALLENYQRQGAISISDAGIVSVAKVVVAAAQIALDAIDSDEGKLISMPDSISAQTSGGGTISVVFASSAVPMSLLEFILNAIIKGPNTDTDIDLSAFGQTNFEARLLRMVDNTYFVHITPVTKAPAFQHLEDVYDTVLGTDSVNVVPGPQVSFAVSSINPTQKTISLLAMDDQGAITGSIGPSLTLTVDQPATVDDAISRLYEWVTKRGITITSITGPLDDRYANLNNLIQALFRPAADQLSEFEQVDEFKKMLRLYSFTAGKHMNKVRRIISERVVNILQGDDPQFSIIPGVLRQNVAPSGTQFGPAEFDLLYHVYLHYLNYLPDQKLIDAIDDVILARILQDSFTQDQPVIPEHARERLLTILRGGKYLAKLDLTSVDEYQSRKTITDIFSDQAGMDTMFENAGLTYSNVRRIRVVESRLSGFGFISDYKVVIEDYQGSEKSLRLRMMLNPNFALVFAQNVNAMKAGKEESRLFPTIYYSKTYSHSDKTPNFYFAEHVDGILADRILKHPDEFTPEARVAYKAQATKAWIRFWEDARVVPDEEAEVLEVSRVMLPILLESVVFPADGSNAKILGIGYAFPSHPSTFYTMLFALNSGFQLEDANHVEVIGTAMIAELGWERTRKLLFQALADYKLHYSEWYEEKPNDITAGTIMRLIAFTRASENLMKRETVQKLVDIVYNGDEKAAFAEIADSALHKGLNPLHVLMGKVAMWEQKIPSVNEVKGSIRRLKPSILSISGGTGGNSLINAIKGGERGTVANIVTTFDSGGQSYNWQGIMDPLIGYVYSMGDTTNLAVSYLDIAKQDLLNKRLPEDLDVEYLSPIAAELIAPSLKNFPQLRQSPEFLIDFIDMLKKVDEFISILRQMHNEDPARYKDISLQKASVKNLLLESMNYFSEAYNLGEGRFDADRSLVALDLVQKLFSVDQGYVVPVSTDEGNIIARLKEPLTDEEMALLEEELADTTLMRNRISADRRSVHGEDFIGEIGTIIPDFGKRVEYLDNSRNPDNEEVKPQISDMAREALTYPALDLILVGPGSLFTSLLANFTVKEVVEGLVARGKAGISVMPDGQRIRIEPAQRVFILNPVHTPEDMGMSVTDIVETIERTARNATGNPDLKFEDMFDTIVINDMSKAMPSVKSYIQKKQLALIEPTTEDKQVLQDKGIQIFSYNMAMMQKRPTRKAGYDLQYDEKLEYNPAKLREMTEILLRNIRVQKNRDKNNFGIGDGHHSPEDYERVRNIIRASEINAMTERNPFRIHGSKWIDLRVQQLERKIERETDLGKKQQLQEDLLLLQQAISLLKSDSIPMFQVRPGDDSPGIFIDDTMRYQFTTMIDTDERGLRHGVYFASGFVDQVQEYIAIAQRYQNAGNQQQYSYYDAIASALSGEALLHHLAEWVLYTQQPESFNIEEANARISRIINEHIALARSIYGTALNEEFASIVTLALTERTIPDAIDAPDEVEVLDDQKRAELLQQKIKTTRFAVTTRESVLVNVRELPANMNDNLQRLEGLGTVVGEIFSHNAFQPFLQTRDKASVYDLFKAYAQDLAPLQSMFDSILTVDILDNWLIKLHDYERTTQIALSIVNGKLRFAAPNQRDTYLAIADILNRIRNDFKSISIDLAVIKTDTNMLDALNDLSRLSVETLEEQLRQVNLRLASQRSKDAELMSIDPSHDSLVRQLDAMNDEELSRWMNTRFLNGYGIQLETMRSDLQEFLGLFETFLNEFPDVRDSVVRGLPPTASTEEEIIAAYLPDIKIIKDNVNLTTYAEWKKVHDAMSRISQSGLFTYIEIVTPVTNRTLTRVVNTGENLFLSANAFSQKIAQFSNEQERTFPAQYLRFLEYLRTSGILPGGNIGLGDGHHSEYPARIDAIISESKVSRLSDEDILLNGVKDHILKQGIQLMMRSKTAEGDEQRALQNNALFLMRIHKAIENNEFRFWTVEPLDGNPGLFIDDSSHYQFAAIRENDVYFASGLINRLRFLRERGLETKVMGMLAESVVHEVGEKLIAEDQRYEYDINQAHEYIKGLGFALNAQAPVSDLDAPPQSLLYRELQFIVDSYLAGQTDVAAMPIFQYPSDMPVLRQQLHDRLLNRELSVLDFLKLVTRHFAINQALGAPAEIVHNNQYYHPGEVLGYIRDFPLMYNKTVLETHFPAAEKVIQLSNSDALTKDIAAETIRTLLSDEAFVSLIQGMAPHELEDMMYDIIRVITADDNPYVNLKNEYNQKGVDALREMEEVVTAYGEELWAAALIAIAGNALDFANLEATAEIEEKGFSFTGAIRDIFNPQVVKHDDFSILHDRLRQPGQTILFATDNAGEIITDFPLLKRLLLMGHTVNLVPRDKHTVNDISLSDAHEIFQSDYAMSYFVDQDGNSLLAPEKFRIITSGSNVTGTDLRRATPEFIEIWQNADLRILKGQGNYETLRYYPLKQDMFFLLKVKDPYATALKYAKGDVMIEYRAPNPIVNDYLNNNVNAVIDAISPQLTEAELEQVKEFIVFYIDYLSTQVRNYAVEADAKKISKIFSEAKLILGKASGIPEIDVALLAKLHKELRGASQLEDFLWTVARPEALRVEQRVINDSRHFMVIDMDAVPEGNLQYAFNILASLNESRKDQTGISVKWVVFSENRSNNEIISELLSRGFYLPEMEIVGSDKIRALDSQWGDIQAAVTTKVHKHIKENLAADSIPDSAIKLITRDEASARYGALNDMFVIQLNRGDLFTEASDFIAALISMDSFIYGGRAADLESVNTETGQVVPFSEVMQRQGFVYNNEFTGKILRMRQSVPVKEKLEQLELKKIVEEAI